MEGETEQEQGGESGVKSGVGVLEKRKKRKEKKRKKTHTHTHDKRVSYCGLVCFLCRRIRK